MDCEFLLHALAVKTLSAQRVAGFGWIFSIECSPSFGLSGSVFFSVFSLASLCITRAVGFFFVVLFQASDCNANHATMGGGITKPTQERTFNVD